MALADNFRVNVRSLIIHRERTQNELAELLGTSKQEVSQILNGRFDGVQMATVEHWAKKLMISAHDMLMEPNKFREKYCGKVNNVE